MNPVRLPVAAQRAGSARVGAPDVDCPWPALLRGFVGGRDDFFRATVGLTGPRMSERCPRGGPRTKPCGAPVSLEGAIDGGPGSSLGRSTRPASRTSSSAFPCDVQVREQGHPGGGRSRAGGRLHGHRSRTNPRFTPRRDHRPSPPEVAVLVDASERGDHPESISNFLSAGGDNPEAQGRSKPGPDVDETCPGLDRVAAGGRPSPLARRYEDPEILRGGSHEVHACTPRLRVGWSYTRPQ